MPTPAAVLVHGATGFTGRLVCAALRRREIPFAISGRSAEKLEALAATLAGGSDAIERCVVDLADDSTLRAALAGRRIVCACAGPFVRVGEPILAASATLGVHYVDTTGEQPFVVAAVERHRAAAEASGACVVPAMAFEIAPADWAAHIAATRVGGTPDAIDIVYVNRPARGAHASSTTRGTKRSIVAMIGDTEPRQFVDGALAHEPAGERVVRFRCADGTTVTASSFPSPESVVVPSHTFARTVRTYMAMGGWSARVLRIARGIVPALARTAAPLADRLVDRAPEGPEGTGRTDARFEIIAIARRGAREEKVHLTGVDPYGLTAEIQAWAASRALAGAITARGVVAPSVAFPPQEAFAALEFTGLRVSRATG